MNSDEEADVLSKLSRWADDAENAVEELNRRNRHFYGETSNAEKNNNTSSDVKRVLVEIENTIRLMETTDKNAAESQWTTDNTQLLQLVENADALKAILDGSFSMEETSSNCIKLESDSFTSSKEFSIVTDSRERSNVDFITMPVSRCPPDLNPISPPSPVLSTQIARAMSQISNTKDDISSNEAMAFKGFTTASNKPIAISERCIAKAKSILFDIAAVDSEERLDDMSISSEIQNGTFQGFKTANNKKISISSEALERANAFLDDDFSSNSKRRNVDDSERCRNVAVSEDKCVDGNFGFKTASNKNIKVSKASLDRVKNLFHDYDEAKTEIKRSPKESDEIINIPRSVDGGCTIVDCNGLTVAKQALECDTKVDILFEDTCLNAQGTFTGFTTANNNRISINPDNLQIAKRMFNHTNIKCNDELKLIDEEDKELINNKEKILDSPKELNYEEEINIKSPPEKTVVMSTVSPNTSPVLLSKRILKRKIFDVPYKMSTVDTSSGNDNKKIKLSKKLNDLPKNICSHQILLGDAYNEKRLKSSTMHLRDMYEMQKKIHNIRQPATEILALDPSNCISFQFKGCRLNTLCDDKTVLTVDEIIEMFIQHKDIDTHLIPEGWALNHVKWIIWKLASYERMFCTLFENNVILNVTNVIKQLKYRYDKELHHAERPALRKILEKDDTPGKRMVLCVSNIIQLHPDYIAANDNITSRPLKSGYELELTDGWYSVIATIDGVLSNAIDKRKIVIGTKLMIYGAELLNCPEGVTPLENSGCVRLKIWANSCRRCLPWTKLGVCSKWNRPMTFTLGTCRSEGGPICSLRVRVVTVYPILFMNKLHDGKIVMKSEKLQEEFTTKREAEYQIKIEQLYVQVESEFRCKKKQTKSLKIGLSNDWSNCSPNELAELIENASDPQELLESINSSQRDAVNKILMDKHALLRLQIDNRVKNIMEEQGLLKEESVRVLKTRIISCESDGKISSAILTIWRPNDMMLDTIREGIYLDIDNLTHTGLRKGELNLSAGKKTVFREIASKQWNNFFPAFKNYEKCCTNFEKIYDAQFSPNFNEVDVVGIVLKILPEVVERNNLQTVYLVNENGTFVAICFWKGVKNSGFNRIIEKGAYIACLNLQHRSKSMLKQIRQLHVTESSNFLISSRKEYILKALTELKFNTKDINIHTYVNESITELEKLLQNQNTNKVLAYNSGNFLRKVIATEHSDSSVSFIKDGEFSLSGLDFDTTFIDNTANTTSKEEVSKVNISSLLGVSSENIPVSIESPSRNELKINKLMMFGEPPPLSPIVLKNSKRVKKTFVPPYICNSNVQDNK